MTEHEHSNQFIANDLQIGSRDIYRCIQFARTFPQLIDMQISINMMNCRTSSKILLGNG